MSRAQALLTAALLAAATLPSYAVPPNDPLPAVGYPDENGQLVMGQRCGVAPLTAEQIATVEAALTQSALEKSGDCVATAHEVPLVFHIITSGATGNLTDAQIVNQVRVLNTAFLGSGISFVVAGVERISNATWFANCAGSSELAMKEELAYDPTGLINIYTCKPAAGLLGVATFPSLYPENDYRHGVILHYATFPGGSAKGYNQGDTAVHEMGHYFGLFHTFQGGCTGQGDFVPDTPAEATANKAAGCPATRNTCASPGLDPVANYMDYSTDACLVNFTLGQVGLMHALVTLYRPNLP